MSHGPVQKYGSPSKRRRLRSNWNHLIIIQADGSRAVELSSVERTTQPCHTSTYVSTGVRCTIFFIRWLIRILVDRVRCQKEDKKHIFFTLGCQLSRKPLPPFLTKEIVEWFLGKHAKQTTHDSSKWPMKTFLPRTGTYE